MAQEFQTSFIPKKTVDAGGTHRGRSSLNLFTLGGIVIFLLTIVAAGGVFAYKQGLERSLASKQEALARSSEAFEPSLIKEFVRLEQRFDLAEELIGKHIAVSHVLGFLEKHTLETVQFDNFSLSREGGDIEVSLSGRANGFTSVALQSDEFGEHPMLQNVLFSGFALANTGEVTFSVNMAVDPLVVEYEPSSIPIPDLDTLDDEVTDPDFLGESSDTDGDDVFSPEDI